MNLSIIVSLKWYLILSINPISVFSFLQHQWVHFNNHIPILGTFLSRLGKNNDLDALILTFDALWPLELSQKETKSSIYHNRSYQLLSLSQLRKYSNWKTINFKLKRRFKAIVSSFSTNNKGFWFYSTQLFPIIVNIFIQRD